MIHDALRLIRELTCTADALARVPRALRHQGCELTAFPSSPRLGPAASHAPVILVHGYAASVDCWDPLRRRLEAAAFDQVLAFRYNSLNRDLPELAESLAGSVLDTLSGLGCETVHLVGHSLGGLLVRLAVEWCGLGRNVATVVTIATPHRGSALAWIAPGVSARRMRPGFSLLTDPVADPGEAQPRYVNFYCSRDAIVPRHSGRLEVAQVKNVQLCGTGHVGAARSELVLSDVPRELERSEASLTQTDRVRWTTLHGVA